MTLSEFQHSLTTRSFDVEFITLSLAGLGTVCAAIAAVILVRSLLARRVRYTPHGSVTDPRIIRQTFRLAFDQRRPFEIQVQTDGNERRPTLRCAPDSLGADVLVVEINGIRSLSSKWLGKALTVYFRVNVDGKFIYYTFSSHIASITAPRPGVCHITLPMPSTLDNRQKRSFLRMAPPLEYLPGAAVWHAESMPAPENYSDLAKWPPPLLLLLPGQSDHFNILDLSAGGCRLFFPGETLRRFGLEFTNIEQIILMLDLLDPESGKHLRFWLLCRIQSAWPSEKGRGVNVGMQFAAWGKPRETILPESPGAIEWLRLSSAREVESIGNWIMRRHLEMFRDIPAEAS